MTIDPHIQEELYTTCIGFATEMLSKVGDFLPFGAHVTADEEIAMVGGDIGEEHPDPRELYQFLLDSFRASAEAGHVTGVALAANVDVPAEYDSPLPDAVRILLESEGYSRFLYVPYEIGQQSVLRRIFRRRRQVTFQEPFAVETTPVVFAESGPGA